MSLRNPTWLTATLPFRKRKGIGILSDAGEHCNVEATTKHSGFADSLAFVIKILGG